VPLGGHHVQASTLGNRAAELDVRAPSRHVGGDGDTPLLTRLLHDGGLPLVVNGVQEVEGEPLPGEHPGKALAFCNAAGAHEHRPPCPVYGDDLLQYGLPFVLRPGKDPVRGESPYAGPVGGYLHHGKAVYMPEFPSGLARGPGHAGKPAEEAEELLEAQARQGLARMGEVKALLCLNRLVQSLAPGAVRHEAAGELIHDHHLPLLDHVLLIQPVELPCGECLGEDLLPARGASPDAGQVIRHLLHPLERLLGEVDLLVPYVPGVIFVRLEFTGDPVGELACMGKGLVFLGPGNDEGGDRLINEHAVCLVNDGRIEPPHHQPLRLPASGIEDAPDHPAGGVLEVAHDQAVAQEIRHDLLARGVHHPLCVVFLPLLGPHGAGNAPHRHPAEMVEGVHFHAVPVGKVVIHGHDVAGPSGPGRKDCGKARGEALSLPGCHLRKEPPVEGQGACDLHRKGPKSQGPVRRLHKQGDRPG